MLKLRLCSQGTKSLDGTSQTVMAANESRRYAIIVNASDVGVWLGFGQDALVGTGVFLAAGGGSYTIDQDNMWNGVITGIAASGSGKTVGTAEFK